MSAAEVLALPDCAQRLQVALEAAWEIEALADLLRRSNDASDSHANELVVRGVMIRVKDLAGIVMAAVGDASDPLPQILPRLTGGDEDTEGGAL